MRRFFSILYHGAGGSVSGVRKYEREEVVELLKTLASREGSWMKLAARIGVSRAYMSDVKLGNRLPGPKILQFLGLEKYEYYVPPPAYRKRQKGRK